MIFSVDIVTNNKEMYYKIKKELQNNGISKYHFKKNYQQLQKIKKHILTKYKHSIDWIEIENIGTKYIIRYEPRIENKNNKTKPLRNIIAKKNSIIHSLDISSGEIIKTKGNYVHKDEVIVSGHIHLNDNIVKTVSSQGKVIGEVWYKVKVDFPLNYYSEIKTGQKKEIYTIKIINKSIELFNIHKYKNKKIENKTIIKNKLLPIKLEKQTQYELKVKDKIYNKQQALKQTIKLGKKKLKKKVLDYQVLNYSVHNNTLTANIFYTVLEDITAYQEIEEYKNETNS